MTPLRAPDLLTAAAAMLTALASLGSAAAALITALRKRSSKPVASPSRASARPRRRT